MQFSLLAARWQPRQVPLTPVAVAACGEAALRLAEKLLALDQEALAKFEGVAGDRLLLLQYGASVADGKEGSANVNLPWVDGVQYLGNDPVAPSLLLPTNYQPVVPCEILEMVFQVRSVRGEKLAVILQPQLLVPMTKARMVSRAALSSWLAGQVS